MRLNEVRMLLKYTKFLKSYRLFFSVAFFYLLLTLAEFTEASPPTSTYYSGAQSSGLILMATALSGYSGFNHINRWLGNGLIKHHSLPASDDKNEPINRLSGAVYFADLPGYCKTESCRLMVETEIASTAECFPKDHCSIEAVSDSSVIVSGIESGTLIGFRSNTKLLEPLFVVLDTTENHEASSQQAYVGAPRSLQRGGEFNADLPDPRYHNKVRLFLWQDNGWQAINDQYLNQSSEYKFIDLLDWLYGDHHGPYGYDTPYNQMSNRIMEWLRKPLSGRQTPQGSGTGDKKGAEPTHPESAENSEVLVASALIKDASIGLHKASKNPVVDRSTSNNEAANKEAPDKGALKAEVQRCLWRSCSLCEKRTFKMYQYDCCGSSACNNCRKKNTPCLSCMNPASSEGLNTLPQFNLDKATVIYAWLDIKNVLGTLDVRSTEPYCVECDKPAFPAFIARCLSTRIADNRYCLACCLNPESKQCSGTDVYGVERKVPLYFELDFEKCQDNYIAVEDMNLNSYCIFPEDTPWLELLPLDVLNLILEYLSSPNIISLSQTCNEMYASIHSSSYRFPELYWNSFIDKNRRNPAVFSPQAFNHYHKAVLETFNKNGVAWLETQVNNSKFPMALAYELFKAKRSASSFASDNGRMLSTVDEKPGVVKWMNISSCGSYIFYVYENTNGGSSSYIVNVSKRNSATDWIVQAHYKISVNSKCDMQPVIFSCSGDLLIGINDLSRSMYIRKTDNLQCSEIQKIEFASPVDLFELSENSRWLIIGSAQNRGQTASLYALQSNAVSLVYKVEYQGNLSQLQFSPDSQHILLCSQTDQKLFSARVIQIDEPLVNEPLAVHEQCLPLQSKKTPSIRGCFNDHSNRLALAITGCIYILEKNTTDEWKVIWDFIARLHSMTPIIYFSHCDRYLFTNIINERKELFKMAYDREDKDPEDTCYHIKAFGSDAVLLLDLDDSVCTHQEESIAYSEHSRLPYDVFRRRFYKSALKLLYKKTYQTPFIMGQTKRTTAKRHTKSVPLCQICPITSDLVVHHDRQLCIYSRSECGEWHLKFDMTFNPSNSLIPTIKSLKFSPCGTYILIGTTRGAYINVIKEKSEVKSTSLSDVN